MKVTVCRLGVADEELDLDPGSTVEEALNGETSGLLRVNGIAATPEMQLREGDVIITATKLKGQ